MKFAFKSHLFHVSRRTWLSAGFATWLPVCLIAWAAGPLGRLFAWGFVAELTGWPPAVRCPVTGMRSILGQAGSSANFSGLQQKNTNEVGPNIKSKYAKRSHATAAVGSRPYTPSWITSGTAGLPVTEPEHTWGIMQRSTLRTQWRRHKLVSEDT